MTESPPLLDLVTRTSKLLYETTPSNKYATAILCAIQASHDRIDYVCGGHNDGLLLKSDGTVRHLASTGPPVGLLPMIPFEQTHVSMEGGDLLALYSDGVVEAQNEAEEEFEEERFLTILQESRDLPAHEVIDRVFEAVEDFAGNAPQHDDITLMIVKKKNKHGGFLAPKAALSVSWSDAFCTRRSCTSHSKGFATEVSIYERIPETP